MKRKPTKEELAAVKAFIDAMRTEVIPKIIESQYRQAVAAEESRRWIIRV